jgi:hypothetical protein
MKGWGAVFFLNIYFDGDGQGAYRYVRCPPSPKTKQNKSYFVFLWYIYSVFQTLLSCFLPRFRFCCRMPVLRWTSTMSLEVLDCFLYRGLGRYLRAMALYRGRIQRKTWCMGPYAIVDYNLILSRLQS